MATGAGEFVPPGATGGGRPPEVLTAGPVDLVRLRGDEVDRLAAAVRSNLDHLRPWMPWAQGVDGEARAAFVSASVAQWEAGAGFAYWMRERERGRLVGCAALRPAAADMLEIGYWVDRRWTRRGIATAAARALTGAALSLRGVERVRIRCDEANVASAGVPRRLGFRLQGVVEERIAAPGETGRMMVWEVDGPGWATA